MSSHSSKISTREMELILEKLKCNKNREGTKANYLSSWCSFNDFVIRLDTKPKAWEDKTALFLAYMIEHGAKSSTIKATNPQLNVYW